MNIGEIENAKVLIFRFADNGRPNHFYFASDDTSLDWCAFYKKYGPTLPPDADYKSVSGVANMDDGWPFWAVYVADCYDPPIAIVRAENESDAIDVAVDAFSWLQVDADMYGGQDEFDKALDDGTVGMADGGLCYDAEQIQVRPMKLYRVEME